MASNKYLKLPQYVVGNYPKNQLDKVQRLFAQAFGGRAISSEMIKWQIEKNPCLKERTTSLWDGDTLVAYNALTPQPTFLNGKRVVTAVSGTTMADEHFPGCSIQLFTECARQNHDIDLIYGFPNRNSFNITVKYLNHHYVGDVAFWIAKAQRKAVSDRIQEFFTFSDEYESLSQVISQKHDFVKVRQKDFLNWRFFQKPEYEYYGFEYEKKGYIVVDVYYEDGNKQLQIVDLISASDDIMAELLGFAVNLAYEWNCEIVKLWLTSEKYKTVLEDAGFEHGYHPFAMTVWNQKLDISQSYITMMDSDIF